MPQVAEHLARCSACRQKLAAMRAAEQTLQQKLYRFDCPSPAQLNHYYWRSLPAADLRQIKRHLRLCPSCAGELKALKDFLAEAPAYSSNRQPRRSPIEQSVKALR